MKVILLKDAPAPEETISMATKRCYSSSDIEALKEQIDARDQKSFVKKADDDGTHDPG